uniref:Plant myosin MYS1 family protein n=1 Tax=Rhizophora mucronata TaxID=61149 RepID=A0A2P2MP46_RHIMU
MNDDKINVENLGTSGKLFLLGTSFQTKKLMLIFVDVK